MYHYLPIMRYKALISGKSKLFIRLPRDIIKRFAYFGEGSFTTGVKLGLLALELIYKVGEGSLVKGTRRLERIIKKIEKERLDVEKEK